MINKYIYKLGVSIRNPSIPKHYSFLKQSEKWSIEQLNQYQLSEAKKCIDFVYRYSPYYNKLLDNIGFKHSKITSVNDIKRIPVIDKNTLIRHNECIHTNYKFKKKFLSETSGSSGQVLKFYKDENWDSFNRASIMRGYSWYNIKPWERNGYLWGYNISPRKRWSIKFLDLLQNRFRLFSYDEKNIDDFVKKLKPASFIEGYSSMIYEVAKVINSTSQKSINLKLVKGTSEKIFESYQNEIIKAFGKKMVSEYGSAESGIIAFECPFGNMHINMEGIIVEEEEGEIIVTNLLSRSFPIIRYKLGDYIKLKPSTFICHCGMNHPVIESVLGRVGKLIFGKTKTYPSFTFYYVFKNIALDYKIELNYQAIQEVKGSLLIKIEQSVNKKILSLIKKEMEKYFKSDLDYSVIDNQVLFEKDRKQLDFVSKI